MRLALIITKPPYGTIHAAEAIRHAMGATGEEFKVSLVLVDGGILLSKRGQFEGETGYTNLEEHVKDIIDLGGEVIVEKASLREFGLAPEDIINGAKIASTYDISETVKSADKIMIF